MKKFISMVILTATLSLSLGTNGVVASSQFSTQLQQKLSNTIVLCIGNSNAYVNCNETVVDNTNENVCPFIKDERTLVPVRFISESLGAKVDWDDLLKKVIITLDDKTIELTINKNVINVNGVENEIDVPAQIMNERTFIPLRALVEALGKKVFWDDRGMIVISNNENVFNQNSDQTLIDEAVGKFENVRIKDTSLATIKTTKGDIKIVLENKKMPITVTNFTKLVKSKFYDGLIFHRAEDWVIQGGDPLGNGTGGSKDTIKLEVNVELSNVRGAIGMARTNDPNSATSQFYILKIDASSWLDGQYAIFGNVIEGMDVVDKIEIGDEIISIDVN